MGAVSSSPPAASAPASLHAGPVEQAILVPSPSSTAAPVLDCPVETAAQVAETTPAILAPPSPSEQIVPVGQIASTAAILDFTVPSSAVETKSTVHVAFEQAAEAAAVEVDAEHLPPAESTEFTDSVSPDPASPVAQVKHTEAASLALKAGMYARFNFSSGRVISHIDNIAASANTVNKFTCTSTDFAEILEDGGWFLVSNFESKLRSVVEIAIEMRSATS